MNEFIDEFERALLSLDRIAAERVLSKSRDVLPPIQFAEKIVAPALERVGHGWQVGAVSLSQVYMSGRICEKLVDDVLPPADPFRKDQPKMAIVVLNDHHLLGKRIVYSVLRASGFELLDYNRMDVDGLVDRAQADQIRLLLISALMLPSALKVKEVQAKLTDLKSEVKILVGGAPFLMDDELWGEVGADAMGRSASEAVGIVTGIMESLS